MVVRGEKINVWLVMEIYMYLAILDAQEQKTVL